MARAARGGRAAGPAQAAAPLLSAAAVPAASAALAAARPVTPALAASAALAAARPVTPALAATAAALSAAADAPAILPFAGAGPPPAEQADIERQRGYEHLLGLQRHYQHKSKWSYFLMCMIAGMLIFQSILLGLVGAEIWTFSGYDWLLPALLVQNLAQIAGLCVIVVQSLFKDIH